LPDFVLVSRHLENPSIDTIRHKKISVRLDADRPLGKGKKVGGLTVFPDDFGVSRRGVELDLDDA